jgi:hypothetical protein
MAGVLTGASIIRCPHPDGLVVVPGLPTLTVEHQNVLPLAQLAPATITGCLNSSGSNNPCLHVVPPASGAAAVLTVNRQPVATDRLTAATDGTPAGWTISAAANQTVLSAS